MQAACVRHSVASTPSPAALDQRRVPKCPPNWTKRVRRLSRKQIKMVQSVIYSILSMGSWVDKEVVLYVVVGNFDLEKLTKSQIALKYKMRLVPRFRVTV
jgi:hypothetical protein